MGNNASGKPVTHSVMVVDDDHLLLEHIEMTLKDAGYMVTIVEDGEAALYLAPSLHLDMIILDSVMPGMSGAEVLRHLKNEKVTADIPVMMLTARTGRDNVEEAVKLGAEDYLAKPVDAVKLLGRVEKLLEKADKKRANDGHMEWKGPSQDFDLPLQKGTRVFLDPKQPKK
ncbi:MAG TPA: response regulator [Magnetospirillaceae bacterium]|jgi:DNA-binding response OmpR family regulator